MKNTYIIQLIAFIFFATFQLELHAQHVNDNPNQQSFSGIEIKTGFGLPFLKWYKFPVNITYQKNLKGKLSVIGVQEFLYGKTDNTDFLLKEYIGFTGIGGGVNFSKKFVQNGVFLTGGIRYYTSKLELKDVDFNKTSLVTKNQNPELGIMYNLKLGRGKVYFASQIYFSLTPIKNFVESDNHTFMVGLGYRL